MGSFDWHSVINKESEESSSKREFYVTADAQTDMYLFTDYIHAMLYIFFRWGPWPAKIVFGLNIQASGLVTYHKL